MRRGGDITRGEDGARRRRIGQIILACALVAPLAGCQGGRGLAEVDGAEEADPSNAGAVETIEGEAFDDKTDSIYRYAVELVSTGELILERGELNGTVEVVAKDDETNPRRPTIKLRGKMLVLAPRGQVLSVLTDDGGFFDQLARRMGARLYRRSMTNATAKWEPVAVREAACYVTRLRLSEDELVGTCAAREEPAAPVTPLAIDDPFAAKVSGAGLEYGLFVVPATNWDSFIGVRFNDFHGTYDYTIEQGEP